MAEIERDKTTNLQLIKPKEEEFYSIQDFNGNSDLIDNWAGEVNTHLKDLTKKVDNIKIPDGTTAEKGIVQLEDSVSSTATNKAATSNSVKNAYDKGVSAYNLASTANGNASSALSRANEAFQSASNGKTAIAGVLGYVSGGNTHQELANEAQYCKNIMANNLNAKGVGANGNYALRDLANLIGNISIQSLGGKRYIQGGTTISTASKKFMPHLGSSTALMYYVQVTGFDFVPRVAVFYNANSSRKSTLIILIDGIMIAIAKGGNQNVFVQGYGGEEIVSQGNLLLPAFDSGTGVAYQIFE